MARCERHCLVWYADRVDSAGLWIALACAHCPHKQRSWRERDVPLGVTKSRASQAEHKNHCKRVTPERKEARPHGTRAECNGDLVLFSR
jgi:hypothetical protein